MTQSSSPPGPLGLLLRKARTAWRMLRAEGPSAVHARLRALWYARRGAARNYVRWTRKYDQPTTADLQRMRAATAPRNGTTPLVAILLDTTGADASALRHTLKSLQAQLVEDWEAYVVPPSDETLRTVLEDVARRDMRLVLKGERGAPWHTLLPAGRSEWTTVLCAGDKLPPHAIWHMDRALRDAPDVGFIYADDDRLDARGRRSAPDFKPDWNPELFVARGDADRAAWMRSSLVSRHSTAQSDPQVALLDLQLQCLASLRAEAILHVPRILLHRTPTRPPEPTATAVVLSRFAQASGWHATVAPTADGHFRVSAGRAADPLVSLIIPTRNQAALVRQCIDSILQKTRYPHYEILLVDNGSDDPEALACFADYARHPAVRLIRDDRPFNYSALNNAAVDVARGSLIGLVNNDIEVITPEWLDEMVAIALRPGVGAVGAKLWYPDDRLQHGGVITGFRGVAGHAHWGLGRTDGGYRDRALLPQALSAVTAACLVLRRSAFDAVGGLDAENLAVAFNDVDLCLKLHAYGLRNVWTPYAELYHHESASRGLDTTPAKKARFDAEVAHMHARWGARLQEDPHYNANLCMEHDSFLLADPPRIAYPF